MTAVSAQSAPTERTFVDRLLAATPLLSIFLWLCIVYAVEAWAHSTPWLFGDELELSQLSRAIAATGHAARRGEPHSFDTLWTYVMAPAWRIHNVHTAYATVKYLAVMIMMLTAFPAYALARQLVGRLPALFVAAASCTIPAMAYSSMLVEEPLAYPYSTFCLFLIFRTLLRRRAGGSPAPSQRDGRAVRARRARHDLGCASPWRRCSSPGALNGSSAGGRRGPNVTGSASSCCCSEQGSAERHPRQELARVAHATDHYKRRIFDFGFHAAGALAIGLGVFPMIAGLASLWRGAGERPTRSLTVFRSVLLAAALSFGVYTAIKSAYVSTVFGSYTYERNLMYLAPLLFVGTALWFERRNFNPVAVAVSAAFTLYLMLTTPYELVQDISYNAPGLAILQQANRYFGLDATGAKIGLVALVLFSAVVLAMPRFVRRGTAWVAASMAVAVLVWNLTGELSFASASNRSSDRFVDNIRRPFTWVDDATGGKPTLYLGQQMADPNGEWLLEFWNPHSLIGRVWSLDGTAPGPGPTLTPDPGLPDGALSHDPHYPYVVEERGMNVVGDVVATHEHVAGGAPQKWRLVKIDPPLRLRDFVTGQYAGRLVGRIELLHTLRQRGEGPGGSCGRRAPVGRTGCSRPCDGQGRTDRDRERQATARRKADDAQALHAARNGVKRLVLPAPAPTLPRRGHVTPTFRPRELAPQDRERQSRSRREDHLHLPPVAEGGAEVAEAEGEQKPRERPAPFEPA